MEGPSFLQNSFYKLMMGDNKSEKFFKVLHDRMKEAQTDIKATVSVNVGEMTYKANEKELETGKTWTWTCLRAHVVLMHHAALPVLSSCSNKSRLASRSVVFLLNCVALKRSPFLQSSLARVIHCWSKDSLLPPSQEPLCFPFSQLQSRRRWRQRWAQP